MTVDPRALTPTDKTNITFCSTTSVHWGTIYGFQASLAKEIEMDGASCVCRGVEGSEATLGRSERSAGREKRRSEPLV